jgi:hypothetical protein
MPFLDTEDMLRGALPDWLLTASDVTLDSWTSEGPVPADLLARLPTTHGGTSSVALHSARSVRRWPEEAADPPLGP